MSNTEDCLNFRTQPASYISDLRLLRIIKTVMTIHKEKDISIKMLDYMKNL